MQARAQSAGGHALIGDSMNPSVLQLASSSFSGTCSPFQADNSSSSKGETPRAEDASGAAEPGSNEGAVNGSGTGGAMAGSHRGPSAAAPDPDKAVSSSGKLAVFKNTAAAAHVERLVAARQSQAGQPPQESSAPSGQPGSGNGRGLLSRDWKLGRWWQVSSTPASVATRVTPANGSPGA